jgi:multidrug efflux pump subunit AcrB
VDEHAVKAPKKPHLGVAGGMAHAFINSPLSPLLLIASLAMGLLGLWQTPRQEDPEISVPMVDVFVVYPGASAEQVASMAIDSLERLMSEIPGVKHVYSAAHRGRGMVTVVFDVGEQTTPSLVKVYDKLASNLDLMPPGVLEPIVKPKGIDDVPILNLTFWSRDVDDAVLRSLALDVLQRLKEVPDTGIGFVVGGRAEQIRIEALPRRLSGFDMSLDELANTIRTANSEMQAGNVELGRNSFTVFSGEFLRSAPEIARLVVGIRNNQPVYVSDLANVYQGPEETNKLVTYYTGQAGKDDPVGNGEPAVTLAIAKKSGSNGVTVANNVEEMVESLKGRLIPDNVYVKVTRNYGETANEKVEELLIKLLVATVAVTLLVWLTLGWRPALVVLLVIPVVILVTVFGALLTGYSINRVSLFALIFSIGILVDDAIVVIENIYRRWLMQGTTDTETAVDAVREVGNPTIVATFTVIAALLPMAFVSGMMGPYMQPIPILGSTAMVFSLFAAFAFTPWLAMRMRPPLKKLEKAEKREHAMHQKLTKFYGVALVPLIKHRLLGWLFLITIVVAWFACVAMFYTTAVVVKMLPYDNKSQFNVVIDMPSGTALPVTANVAREMVQTLRNNIDEIMALQSYVGTASPFDFNGMVRHYYLRSEPWQANIEVQLLPKGDRSRSSHQIALRARELLEPVAHRLGVRNFSVVEMPPGPPVLQSVVAEVYGPTAEVRRQVAADLTGVFRNIEGDARVVDVDNYMLNPHNVLRFRVDTEKAVRRGISTDTINRSVNMAMGGHKLGDVKQGRALEPIYIVLQVPLAERSQLGRLLDLPIPSAAEIPVIPQAMATHSVPLAELGRFEYESVDPVIYHKDLRPVEYVVGDVVGRLGAPLYGMLAIGDALQGYQTPEGGELTAAWIGTPDELDRSGFAWTGEWTVTYETFRDMGIAFAVALVLIYILIVGEFGNFMLPAIIMAPIPLTLLGIVPGHWLLGAEFTATSMIGFIALAGIIVRNSILLVDFARHEVWQGREVSQAVVMAVETRTRPIVITALALVLGSSVILFDPIFQGMAVSLLFGVLVSTLLTLIVIPLGAISARRSFAPPKLPEAPGSAQPGVPIPPSRAEPIEEPKRKIAARSALLPAVGRIGMALAMMVGALLMQLWRHVLYPLLGSSKERVSVGTGREAPTGPAPAAPSPLPIDAQGLAVSTPAALSAPLTSAPETIPSVSEHTAPAHATPEHAAGVRVSAGSGRVKVHPADATERVDREAGAPEAVAEPRRSPPQDLRLQPQAEAPMASSDGKEPPSPRTVMERTEGGEQPLPLAPAATESTIDDFAAHRGKAKIAPKRRGIRLKPNGLGPEGTG